MAQDKHKKWKFVKVPNETYKKIKKLSPMLAKKEFSSFNVSLAEAVAYAVTTFGNPALKGGACANTVLYLINIGMHLQLKSHSFAQAKCCE